jgi:Fe-S cluster biogenesis protein NfuA
VAEHAFTSSPVPVQAVEPTADVPTGPVRARLDNGAVHERLAVLDGQLAQLEVTPGPVGELALVAVAGLAEIYSQALARALDMADPALVERMLRDELIGHLLALHGLHPEPVEARVVRVIEGLKGVLSARGAEVELAGIDDAVATLRVSVSGCGSGSAAIDPVVRDAVLAAVPELTDVTTVPAQRSSSPTFVPLDSLMRPATSAVPS